MDSVILVPNGNSAEAQLILEGFNNKESYIVWCNKTKQFWFVTDKKAFEENFLYTGDVEVYTIIDKQALQTLYKKFCANIPTGKTFTTIAYMLYNDELKIYEPYTSIDYPLNKYGKPIPRGMIASRFKDRFARDKKIKEYMDLGYTCISNKEFEE